MKPDIYWSVHLSVSMDACYCYTQIWPFFGLWHFGMSPNGSDPRTLNEWMWMHNCKPSPIQWYQNCLYIPTTSQRTHAHKFCRSQACHSQCDVTSMTYGSVTDKQKKIHIFGRPGSGWNPSPTKRGTVIEDLEHILSPPKKCLGVRRTVLPLGGTENLGNPDFLNLKPP